MGTCTSCGAVLCALVLAFEGGVWSVERGACGCPESDCGYDEYGDARQLIPKARAPQLRWRCVTHAEEEEEEESSSSSSSSKSMTDDFGMRLYGVGMANNGKRFVCGAGKSIAMDG